MGIQYTTMANQFVIPTTPYVPGSKASPFVAEDVGTCMLLAEHGLYVIRGKGKDLIYAWLTNDEFERLAGSEGFEVLQQKLAPLKPPLPDLSSDGEGNGLALSPRWERDSNAPL